MDKALSFFRVFDVAFFAPGTVLYLSLHVREDKVLGSADPLAADAVSGTAESVVSIVVTIALLYCIGVAIHGLHRFTHQLIGKQNLDRFHRCLLSICIQGSQPAQVIAWYDNIDSGARTEVAIYFWYMRATCWNLAFSGLISMMFYLFPASWYALALLIFVFLAYWLGTEYDRALDRAVGSQ